ncbi:hypothetical protein HDU92_008081, partial [Lobulomyces angularis]
MKILIIGSGVFGVSSAIQLRKYGFEVSIIDRSPIPAVDAASTDISKVLRTDYGVDKVYTRLCLKARKKFLEFNKDSKVKLYHESGVAMLAKESNQCDLDSISTIKSLSDDLKGINLLNDSQVRLEFLKSKPGFKKFFDIYKNGYFNNASGWVNAEESINFFIKKAREIGVNFFCGNGYGFRNFVYEDIKTKEKILGVETTDSTYFDCELVLVAAGSWTPSILPELKGCLTSTGHPVLLIKVPPELRDKYSYPNFSVWSADVTKTGFYGFPLNEDNILKIAIHGSGYVTSKDSPLTVLDNKNLQIPIQDLEKIRNFCIKHFPDLFESENDSEVFNTRICWYCDSFDSDFFITSVPSLSKNLVIATGGSGHAFKFLPVLGELVLPVVLKTLNDFQQTNFKTELKIEPKFLFRSPTNHKFSIYNTDEYEKNKNLLGKESMRLVEDIVPLSLEDQIFSTRVEFNNFFKAKDNSAVLKS